MSFPNSPARDMLLCLMLVSYLLLRPIAIQAQEPEEAEMENLAGRSDAEHFETDELQPQATVQTARIDLNRVDVVGLMSTGMLTGEQVAAFINYRRLLGNFVSIYEIQAVPGWDLELIGRLKTYIMVAEGSRWSRSEIRLRPKSENLLVVRAARQIERSRGYTEKDSLGNPHYLGKPGQLYLRYRLSLKNALHAGFTAEKDAGEIMSRGFDFYSFHIMLNMKGWLKWIVLGDYSVSMGQGLIQWQGLSFPKSSDLALLNRQAQTIRPYQSSGESRFHRGIAAGWQIGNWQGAIFGAEDQRDANLEAGAYDKFHITSIIESGYHRSASELAAKNVFHQQVLGNSLGIRKKSWQLNANFISYRFNYPIERQTLPYNIFAISGRSWCNYGIDYSLNLGSYRLFGELARDARGATGGLAGLVMSVDPALDLGLLYRNLGARYRSMEASAFTESSEPANESGIWLGLNLRPNRNLSFAAFADFFNFPWLKYRVDAPSNGVDYLLKGNWHPDKLFEMESRLRFNSKAANDSIAFGVHQLVNVRRMSWRNQFNYALSGAWTMRSRVELSAYQPEGSEMMRGFLTNLDIFYNPPKSLFRFNFRLEWFDTDAYDSRVYSYENDLPYFYYVPALFGRGFRHYLNVKISYHSKFTMGLKWAQTIFSGEGKIGSGWDEIKGKKRSDFRVELLIKF